WVSELVAVAGGTDVFAHLATQKAAPDRVVAAADVIAAAPDIIIGSWCGKKFVPARVAARPGFAAVPAVRDGWLREIKSPLILQPGPAALTDGLDALQAIIAAWAGASACTWSPLGQRWNAPSIARRCRLTAARIVCGTKTTGSGAASCRPILTALPSTAFCTTRVIGPSCTRSLVCAGWPSCSTM